MTQEQIQEFMLLEKPDVTKSQLVISNKNKESIERIIYEYRQRHKLKKYGLTHCRKILLIGPSGTGKTMTAKVLASEIHLPLYTVFNCKDLKLTFKLIQQDIGIYLFDNLIETAPSTLNLFLQLIEWHSSDSIIIVTERRRNPLTPTVISYFNSFNNILRYELPDNKQREQLIKNKLAMFLTPNFSIKPLITESYGLTHAEICQACYTCIKSIILSEKTEMVGTIIDSDKLCFALDELCFALKERTMR
jgi:SpoVK/Ycf46/Vps4 family AAA+-type ATPase